MDTASSQCRDNHGERLLDGICVTQWIEDVGAEAGAGADGGPAGAPHLLVVIAKSAGSEGRRFALEAVGFSVAAKRVVGMAGVHGCSFFGLKWKGPQAEGLRPLLFSTVLIIGF
jgi:hypothetical protein